MSWDDYNRERVDNIKSQVPVTDILDYYGVSVRTKNREFQFPCPLHGDGQDNSYSARMYPDSDSTYCFACHQDRDVVQWVIDAEGLTFGKALSFIERSFGVTNIPTPRFDPNDEKTRKEMTSLVSKQQTAPTLMDNIRRTEAKLRRAARSNREKLEWKKVAKAFYILDNIRYDVQHANVEDQKVLEVLKSLFAAAQSWESL